MVKEINLQQLNEAIKIKKGEPMKHRALLIVKSGLRDDGCDMEKITGEDVDRIVNVRRAGEQSAIETALNANRESLLEALMGVDEALGEVPIMLFSE